jgi:hypothetical protein
MVTRELRAAAARLRSVRAQVRAVARAETALAKEAAKCVCFAILEDGDTYGLFRASDEYKKVLMSGAKAALEHARQMVLVEATEAFTDNESLSRKWGQDEAEAAAEAEARSQWERASR